MLIWNSYKTSSLHKIPVKLYFILQVDIAKVLIRRHKVETKHIAVLTPYSAQKNLIEEKMSKANLNVKVASITESQGEVPDSLNYDIVLTF